MAGCAGSHTTAPPTTPRVSPEDDDATPPYEPAFSWLVRPLPTRGAVRLVLYVDAGSRDSTPPQVATLAAYAFFCGSGRHTTQGMGQTRLAEPAP